MKRNPHDPEGKFERRNYKLNHMVDDVFCVSHPANDSFQTNDDEDVGLECCAREDWPRMSEGLSNPVTMYIEARNRALEDKPTITDLVHEVIRQREVIGMATYHRPLRAGDGRDTLQDAIEEAADLLQYLVKLKVERAGTGG